MSLEEACEALARLLKDLPNIQRAHSNPPNSLNQLPALLVYPSSGTFEAVSHGLGRAIHTISVEIIHARQSLPSAVEQVRKWPEEVYRILLQNPTLEESVQHIVWPVTYRILPLRYGSDVFFGIRFEIKVKIME
jgi:hypothetical protein